jgi:hypothetical protein
MTQYIELTSQYRNRNEFPLQARFCTSTNISNGNIDLFSAKDPVSFQYPYYIGVVGSAFDSSVTSTFNGGTNINPELDPTTLTTEDDYYKGYTLRDITISEDRIIRTYTASSASVSLSLPYSNIWASTDQYQILDTSTIASDQLTTQPYNVYNNARFGVLEAFVGMYAYVYHWDGTKYILGTYPVTKTTSFDTTFMSYTLANSIGPFVDGDITMIRKEEIVANGLLQSATGGNQVTLSTTASSVKDFYAGKFFFLVPFNVPGNIDPVLTIQNHVYKIVKYDGLTKVATLDRPLVISNYIQPTVVGNLQDRLYEILEFSFDNAQPYFFSGSRLSQETSGCTELEITDIILPNVSLKTGSRSSLYPYFYVSIESANASFNSNTSIYSNNPNSRKMNFIAPMYDTSDPFSTAFIKLNSSMIPTLKFNPKEPLSLVITLPDGTLFQTLEEDNPSPLPPNPLLQLTVILSSRRI